MDDYENPRVVRLRRAPRKIDAGLPIARRPTVWAEDLLDACYKIRADKISAEMRIRARVNAQVEK